MKGRTGELEKKEEKERKKERKKGRKKESWWLVWPAVRGGWVTHGSSQ